MPENQVFGQSVGGGHNRAAEVLHITQPTLSRQLSQLEDGMGVKLFHRGAKKITLTSAGTDGTGGTGRWQNHHRRQRIVRNADTTGDDRIFSGKYPRVTFDLFTGGADLVKEHFTSNLSTNAALMVRRKTAGLLISPLRFPARTPPTNGWKLLRMRITAN